MARVVDGYYNRMKFSSLAVGMICRMEVTEGRNESITGKKAVYIKELILMEKKHYHESL